MKLLFDQNISFRILNKLKGEFPDCQQVKMLGLENSSDREIWEFAKKEGYTIITFDMDFYDFSIVWGSPPKIVWLRTSNQKTDNIAKLILKHKNSIYEFSATDSIDCLEIIENAPFF